MRAVSERRWRTAQHHEEAFQRGKAARIRDREIHLFAARTARALEVRARLAPFLPLDARTRVLEVGCGPHGVSLFFDGPEVIATDPLGDFYDEAFAWARRGDNVRTMTARGEALPFPDASFDLVVSDNVLDHTRDPELVLSEIARVAKPGAALYFAVNVHEAPFHWLTRAHERFLAEIRTLDMLGPHPYAFRREDAVALASRAGFRIAWERLARHEASDHGHGDESRGTLRRLARRAFERTFPVSYWESVCILEGRQAPAAR